MAELSHALMADYKAVNEAGFASPEELLAAYKYLATQENAARRRIDELVTILTSYRALMERALEALERTVPWCLMDYGSVAARARANALEVIAGLRALLQERSAVAVGGAAPEVIEQCAECAAYDPDATCPRCRFIKPASGVNEPKGDGNAPETT